MRSIAKRPPKVESPADLADEINAAHRACTADLMSGLNHARRCGQLLLKAKASVKHGEWLSWIQDNCQFSERTAQYYLRVVKNWEAIEKTEPAGSVLSFRKARQIAKPVSVADVIELAREDLDIDELLAVDELLPFDELSEACSDNGQAVSLSDDVLNDPVLQELASEIRKLQNTRE
jgi:hypothetical protein